MVHNPTPSYTLHFLDHGTQCYSPHFCLVVALSCLALSMSGLRPTNRWSDWQPAQWNSNSKKDGRERKQASKDAAIAATLQDLQCTFSGRPSYASVVGSTLPMTSTLPTPPAIYGYLRIYDFRAPLAGTTAASRALTTASRMPTCLGSKRGPSILTRFRNQACLSAAACM